MRLTNFYISRSMACTCVLFLNLSTFSGCFAGDDPATVALIEKHVAPLNIGRGVQDPMGARRITRLSAVNKTAAAEIFPHLAKLEYLDELAIGWDGINDTDLELLPALPNLKILVLGRPGITDDGLKHLAGMTGLKELRLGRTSIVGPGLAHLKGFDRLEWLELTSTKLDDSGIPHIAANFPKLRRLDMGKTKITPKGLMQLVDLHWLATVGVPDDIIGPLLIARKMSDEERREIHGRRQALRKIYVQFNRAHLASKQKARAAGLDVPPDDRLPFGAAGTRLENEHSEQDSTATQK